MIQTVMLGGPWKGIITSAHPRQIPKDFFSYSENIRYRFGRAMLIGALSDPEDLPSGVGSVLHIENVPRRNGTTVTMLLGTEKVYAGSISSFLDVTPTGWGTGTPTMVSAVHVVTGGAEYYCFVNDVDDGFFYYDMDTGTSTKVDLTSADVSIKGGKYLGLFKDQIIIANIRGTSTILDAPNGYVYGSTLGPLDFNGASSGDNQIIDTEGPINAVFRIQDYFAFAKPWSITIAQYTGIPEDPHRLFTIDGVGVGAPKSVARIPSAQVVVFLGMDAQLYVFNGQAVKPIGDPVFNLLYKWAKMNDSKTQITNVVSAVIPAYGEYWLVFEDKGIIVWNYVDNTWQIYIMRDDDGKTQNIIGFGEGFTVSSAVYWDDVTQDWDSVLLDWDDFGGAVSSAVPIVVVGTQAFRLGAQVTNNATIRTYQMRLPKPTQISRVVLDIYAPSGGTVKCRYSNDGGTKWSTWTSIVLEAEPLQNPDRRAFWNFIATGDRWQFEFDFSGQPYMELLDIGIDFVVHKGQEVVTPASEEHNVAN